MSISIRTRLVGCILALGVALAAVGAGGWYGTARGSEVANNLVSRHIVPIGDLKIVADMYAVNIVDTTHKLGFGAVSWSAAASSVDAAKSALLESWKDFRIAFRDDPEPGDAELIATAEAEMIKADKAVAHLESILQAQDLVALEQFRTSEMYPAIDTLSTAIASLVDSKIKGAEEDIALFDQEEAQIQLIFSVLGGISALMILIALWIVIKQVVQPINQITDTMRRLAGGDNKVDVPGEGRKDEIGRMAASVVTFRQNAVEKVALETAKAREAAEDHTAIAALASGLTALAAGDLTHRIDAKMAPKTQKLKDDFNKAIEQLEEALSDIASNAGGIQTGAGEISQAADDLSRRTEQQAATLEQTAAALDQITATVKKTASGATQANVVVASARADAEKSGEVVSSAVNAMGQIENSAQKISHIIGVIDEIAFQTNLLALNAGVEAARAGEAGRGFAVVASEVRALAQRSADAAKEIKSLIHASTNQVESGVELVGQTGHALQRIVKQVAEITTLVSEIAASAQEQSTALSQVNTAVNQMDQVTQQNAAMVEQSTAASHNLAQESAELNRLVGRFKVRGSSPPIPEARPSQRRTAATQMRTTSQRKVLPAPATDAEWEEF